MLLEIDDADAAVLFAALPGLHSNSDAALARVRARLAEEGRRTLHWILVDEDIQMGVYPAVESGSNLRHGTTTMTGQPPVSPPAPASTPASTRSLPLPLPMDMSGGYSDYNREDEDDSGDTLLSPIIIEPFLSPLQTLPPLRSLSPSLSPVSSASPMPSPLSPSPSSVLSPTITLVGSEILPDKSTLKKRTLMETETGLGPEVDSQPRSKRRRALSDTEPCPGTGAGASATASTSASGGKLSTRAAGGGAGDNYDPPRNEHCPRGANRSRLRSTGSATQSERTIAQIQQQLQEELDGEPQEQDQEADGQSQGRWSTKGEPPALCARTARPIVWLSYTTTSPEIQQKLIDLLSALSPAGTEPTQTTVVPQATDTFAQLAFQCHILENGTVLNDFLQMMSYINLTLYIAWLRKVDGIRRNSMTALASRSKDDTITSRRLEKWWSAGSRLIYLAAASSMYLIPIFAASGMKSDICFKYSCKQIQVLAFSLCNPSTPDGTHSLTTSCGELIRSVIVPQMALIRQVSSVLDTTSFSVEFPGDPIGKAIPFSSVKDMRSCLRSFKPNFFALPQEDPVWDVLLADMLTPAAGVRLATYSIDASCVAEEIRINTPLDLQSTPCPVTKQNLEPWTKCERKKAGDAKEVQNISELTEAVQDLHKGGVRDLDKYIGIDTKICEGKVLHIRDKNNKLLALVATNLLESLPHLQTTLISQLASLMAGEIYSDKSDRLGYSFLAWHCSYYNRYAEKGHDAPKDVHPNYIKKKDKSRVNHTQRVPHASKEVEENPEEAAMLAELIHLITIIVEHHVKRFLPEDYEEIKLFVTRLPLNERSLAYPFGGFVINVSVSTRGHRDRFDKLFCVIIPFGNWSGGELCLYEPGFVFRLHPWDILIFPSCDITHFNLDFEGIRLSLVLHSDKYGDQWVRDGNGWLPNDDDDDSQDE